MVRKIPNRCVGRRTDGRQCYSSGVQILAGVPFCLAHVTEVAKQLGVQVSPTRIVKVAIEAPHVVYYAGDPATQTIKIGTSHNFRGRIAALAARRPGLKLLAVEPGHFDLEAARHEQFKHLRVGARGTEREWYRRAGDLMEHIQAVRTTWGDPATYRPAMRLMTPGQAALEILED